MIKLSPTQYPYSGHPHGVLLSFAWVFYNYAIKCGSYNNRNIEMDFNRFETGLSKGLAFSNSSSFSYILPSEVDGESVDVATFMKDEFENDDCELYENQVPWFENPNKYIARAAGTNWEYWSVCRPFEFPAVAYSREEIHVWILWSLKYMLIPSLVTHQHQSLLAVVSKFIDVEHTVKLMQLLFSGNKQWTYGPARKHEPNFDLWHQLTVDPLMNKVILEFPSIRPTEIRWWKDLPWNKQYEMDFDVFW